MPESRIEQYLEYLAFGTGELPEKPESRVEEYLLYLCQNGGLGKFEAKVVDTSEYPTLDSFLSSTGEERIIYLYPDSTAKTPNKHKEYIWIKADSKFELIGNTGIDLSKYYTITQVNDLLSDKVDKVEGKGLSSNDYTNEEKTKLSQVAAGAQVNKIEKICVNGVEVTPDSNKKVNIEVSGGGGGYSNLYLHSYRCGMTSSDNLTQLMLMITLILPRSTAFTKEALQSALAKIAPLAATGSVSKRSSTTSPYTIEYAICGISFGDECIVWYNGASNFIRVPLNTLWIYNSTVNEISTL